VQREDSLPVTDLTTYLFCPRKLYLKKVLKLKEPLNINVVLGQVHHEVLENFYKNEKEIVSSITPNDNKRDILLKYKTAFYQHLVKAIAKRRNIIKTTALSPIEIFQQMWTILQNKAEHRCANIISCIEHTHTYKTELWHNITPKITTEIGVCGCNLPLYGRVDQLEETGSTLIPVEIKNSDHPSGKRGPWESHEIQLNAYIMILKEKHPEINTGYIEYNNCREKVEICSKREARINLLISEVKKVLNSRSIPPISKNKNKCVKCGLMAQCHSIEF